MSVWEFDVSVSTHDELKRGCTELWWLNTAVEADTYLEAGLVACWMALAQGWYVTGLRYRE